MIWYGCTGHCRRTHGGRAGSKAANDFGCFDWPRSPHCTYRGTEDAFLLRRQKGCWASDGRHACTLHPWLKQDMAGVLFSQSLKLEGKTRVGNCTAQISSIFGRLAVVVHMICNKIWVSNRQKKSFFSKLCIYNGCQESKTLHWVRLRQQPKETWNMTWAPTKIIYLTAIILPLGLQRQYRCKRLFQLGRLGSIECIILKIEIPVWILKKEKLNIFPLPLLVHKHLFFLP